MTRTSLSLFNKLRPYSIGFDNAFDTWDRFFTDDFNLTSAVTSSFPAYDIIKKNDHQYQIQLALAGFSKDDIEVEVKENTLSIRSVDKKEEVETDEGDVIHKGIAKRHFERTFTIADDTVVKGAELKDGLLSVELERVIPEEKKAKLIDIK
jgi:molecular chaperone IbpA